MFQVFSKTECPFCVEAKKLLLQVGQEYKEVNIESDIEKYRKWMREDLGVRTVPVIFHGETFVGGFTELQDYLVENNLV